MRPSDVDDLVRGWIVAHRLHALDVFFLALSFAGRLGAVWLAAGAALLSARRIRLRAFGQLVLSIVIAWPVVEVLTKPIIARDRPFVHLVQIAVIGAKPTGSSFPSGHAATSFAAAFVLSRLVPAWRLVWWTTAIAIAYSRVYLGVHYPLDVVAGALVGLVCGFVATRLIISAESERQDAA